MSKAINLHRLVLNARSPSDVCVLGFELTEATRADTPNLKLEVQITAPKQTEPVTGWIDTTGLNFSQFLLYTWKDAKLWQDFWEACRSRVNPADYEKEERKTTRGQDKARKAKEQELFKVYQLEGFRVVKKQPKFTVSWQFYPDSENSEEPTESLPQMLHTYCWQNQSDWTACCEHFANTHKPKLARSAAAAGAKAQPAASPAPVPAAAGVAKAQSAPGSQQQPKHGKQGGEPAKDQGTSARDAAGPSKESAPAAAKTAVAATAAAAKYAAAKPATAKVAAPQAAAGAVAQPTGKSAKPVTDKSAKSATQPAPAPPATAAGTAKDSGKSAGAGTLKAIQTAAAPAAASAKPVQPAPAAQVHAEKSGPTQAADVAGRAQTAAAGPSAAPRQAQQAGPSAAGPSGVVQRSAAPTPAAATAAGPAAVQEAATAVAGLKRKAPAQQLGQPPASTAADGAAAPAEHEVPAPQAPAAVGSQASTGADAGPAAGLRPRSKRPATTPDAAGGAGPIDRAATGHEAGPSDAQHEAGAAPTVEQGRRKGHAGAGTSRHTDADPEDLQNNGRQGSAHYDSGDYADGEVDYDEAMLALSGADRTLLHVENTCRYFYRRFRDKFPICRKDGYFWFYRKQKYHKGQVDYVDHVERASQRMTGQLSMDPDELHQGMEVFVLEDPCDPCYNNPYVKGDMTCMQKGCRAGKAFQKGDVVGMYMGRVITKSDHNLHAPRDEWELDTPDMAYTMMIAWSDFGGVADHELLLEGDAGGRCPTVFVNHEYYWGECRRGSSGLPCNCHLYKERKANLEVQHGFKIENGQLTPLTWMAANRDIPVGEVLLTEWALEHLNEMGNAYVRQKLFERDRRLHAKLSAVRARFEEKGIDPEGSDWNLDLQPLSPPNPEQANTMTTTGGNGAVAGGTGAGLAGAGAHPPTPLHPLTLTQPQLQAPGTTDERGALVSWGVPGLAGPSRPAAAPAAGGATGILPPSPVAAGGAAAQHKRARILEVPITGVSGLRAQTLAGRPVPLLSNFHPQAHAGGEHPMPLSAPGGAGMARVQQGVQPGSPSGSGLPGSSAAQAVESLFQEFIVQMERDALLSNAERTRRLERLQAWKTAMLERDRMPKNSDSRRALDAEVDKLEKEVMRLIDRQNNKYKRTLGTAPGGSDPAGGAGWTGSQQAAAGATMQPLQGALGSQRQLQQHPKPRQLVTSNVAAAGAMPGRKRSHAEAGV